MSKTIKRFEYRVIKMRKHDRLPFNPHVEIVLEHWATGNDGVPIVSPHLMTDIEIDEYVQQLKADLDAVGKKAKAALRRASEETIALVSSRNSN